jgi:sporulation protein YlmC with PRC-barrel domain
VPVSQISLATEQKVIVIATDPDALPNFIDTEYVGIGGATAEEQADVATSLYWYPPVGAAMWGYPPLSELPIAGHRHIPEGTIALHEGAQVMSADGKHVGDVEEVIVEDTDHRVSHFVLSRGLLFPEKKLVPMAWVKSVADEEVVLNVETAILAQVRPYLD